MYNIIPMKSLIWLSRLLGVEDPYLYSKKLTIVVVTIVPPRQKKQWLLTKFCSQHVLYSNTSLEFLSRDERYVCNQTTSKYKFVVITLRWMDITNEFSDYFLV